MPEETIDENGNFSAGGSFKWCDGALLKAIKNGDWVLLQLSVYITELDQAFDCPPIFRMFATQNPLAQGGSPF
jgi:midasin